MQPLTKGMQTDPVRGVLKSVNVDNFIDSIVGLAPTAATGCVEIYAAAAAKEHVVVALRLAKSSLKYAARRQLSKIAQIITIAYSQCQYSCRLRYCRLLCVAVTSISSHRVSKSAPHDS